MKKINGLVLIVLLLEGMSLHAQSTLPPEKQAIEDQYTQERASGIQNAAPKDPNAPFPIAPEVPFRTGIIDDCSPPFSAQNVSIQSCWQGLQNGIRTAVFTGAESDNFDAQQGIVYVMTIPDFPAETTVQTILTPVRAGAVSIVLAQNNILTLVSETGPYVMVFDVNAAGFTSVVLDTKPPRISGMPNNGCTLWPPDHKFVQVADVKATDAESGIFPGSFVVTANSNEPQNPIAPDVIISADGSGGFTVQLRADRFGTGIGRIYTITATASDLGGNTSTSTVTCAVPHDQGNN